MPGLPASEGSDNDDVATGGRRRSKTNRSGNKKAKRKSRADRKRKSKAALAAAAGTSAGFEPPPNKEEKKNYIFSQNIQSSTSSRASSTATTASTATSASAGISNSSAKRFAPLGFSPASASEGVGRDVGNADGDTLEAAKAARAKAMVPMRPEEYAAQQRTIREVRGRGYRGCLQP